MYLVLNLIASSELETFSILLTLDALWSPGNFFECHYFDNDTLQRSSVKSCRRKKKDLDINARWGCLGFPRRSDWTRSILISFVVFHEIRDFFALRYNKVDNTLSGTCAWSDFILRSDYAQRFTSHYHPSSLRALYCPLVPFSVPRKDHWGSQPLNTHLNHPSLAFSYRDQYY